MPANVLESVYEYLRTLSIIHINCDQSIQKKIINQKCFLIKANLF